MKHIKIKIQVDYVQRTRAHMDVQMNVRHLIHFIAFNSDATWLLYTDRKPKKICIFPSFFYNFGHFKSIHK